MGDKEEREDLWSLVWDSILFFGGCAIIAGGCVLIAKMLMAKFGQ